jgi:kynurenine formamidase
MGRRDYATYSKSWTPPTYKVDDDGKVVDGYRPAGRNNWGRWGDDDRRGTANLIDAERVLQAARLVRHGDVYSLALPIDATAPRWPDRQPHNHYFLMTGSDSITGNPYNELAEGFIFNDDSIDMSLQGSTQWDGLGHVEVKDTLYNGFWAGNITATGGDSVLGIGRLAESFVGRGVLIDLAHAAGVESLAPGTVVTPEMLDAACESQGLTVEEGDVVLLRTGFQPRWWSLTNDDEKREYWSSWPGPGLAGAEWLLEHGASAAACDTVGFEVMPGEGEEIYPVHQLLLVDCGFTIGEMWELEKLSAACAEDGSYEFLLIAPPLNFPRAVGSPLNPIAIK